MLDGGVWESSKSMFAKRSYEIRADVANDGGSPENTKTAEGRNTLTATRLFVTAVSLDGSLKEVRASASKMKNRELRQRTSPGEGGS